MARPDELHLKIYVDVSAENQFNWLQATTKTEKLIIIAAKMDIKGYGINTGKIKGTLLMKIDV